MRFHNVNEMGWIELYLISLLVLLDVSGYDSESGTDASLGLMYGKRQDYHRQGQYTFLLKQREYHLTNYFTHLKQLA
jgi:hypothetical protein